MSTENEVEGYKPQSPEKIALVNRFKVAEQELGDLWKEVMDTKLADPRMMAIAKTKLQEGFMWANRSIFQPEDTFQ